VLGHGHGRSPRSSPGRRCSRAADWARSSCIRPISLAAWPRCRHGLPCRRTPYRSGVRAVSSHRFRGKNASHFLIREAVRGEGAVLVNSCGKHFMEDAHPMGRSRPAMWWRAPSGTSWPQAGSPVCTSTLRACRRILARAVPNIYERLPACGVDNRARAHPPSSRRPISHAGASTPTLTAGRAFGTSEPSVRRPAQGFTGQSPSQQRPS